MHRAVPHRAIVALIWLVAAFSWPCQILADLYDPPDNYYNAAVGTGATLKTQLHDIIKGHTKLSYDSARTNLQITDADPNNPGHMLSVYDRVSIDVSSINPDGPIPGWDAGATWNREHTWPQSRGITSTSPPDGTDLFELRPSSSSTNGSRSNLNYGGAFGQPYGRVTDGGATVWYPGDADAGMIARQEFYMAVRYDGTESGTTDLELAPGNPASGGSLLGNLNRLVEWNYAAPPDDFERRRNQIIYTDYQHNRDPFTDHPEWVWSVFVNQMNDSQISIDGASIDANGGSTMNVNLGRVYVGGAPPASQTFNLSKLGNDGTYFDVATSGDATSSLNGRYNAFRTDMTDNRTIEIGLNPSTATAGLKTGSVTIDNLDVTTEGGAGHGANDGDDIFNVSVEVVDHPVASFSLNLPVDSRTIDLGTVAVGQQASYASRITNLAANGVPPIVADLDLDSVDGSGDTDVLFTDLSPFKGLAQGDIAGFNFFFTPTSVGLFNSVYTLNLSDEDLPGEQFQTLTLNLIGAAVLAGDFNSDGLVNAADYTAWRDGLGTTYTIDDYDVWKAHFGESAAGAAARFSSVPEPTVYALLITAAAWTLLRRQLPHHARRTSLV